MDLVNSHRSMISHLIGLGSVVVLVLICSVTGSCSTSVDGEVASSTEGASYGAVEPSSSSGGENSLGVTKDISTWALPFDVIFDQELKAAGASGARVDR